MILTNLDRRAPHYGPGWSWFVESKGKGMISRLRAAIQRLRDERAAEHDGWTSLLPALVQR